MSYDINLSNLENVIVSTTLIILLLLCIFCLYKIFYYMMEFNFGKPKNTAKYPNRTAPSVLPKDKLLWKYRISRLFDSLRWAAAFCLFFAVATVLMLVFGEPTP